MASFGGGHSIAKVCSEMGREPGTHLKSHGGQQEAQGRGGTGQVLRLLLFGR